MEKDKPADWLLVKPGSIITVSDAQGIADSMKRGLGVKGIDYTVKTVLRLEQLDGLSKHLVFTLYDAEQSLTLVVKIVDDLVDLYVYFDVPGLFAGTRAELLNRNMFWLFQQPANPDHYEPAELQYAVAIRQNVERDGKDVEIVYNEKPQGELQCKCVEIPPRSGMSAELLATLVEYRAEQPTENPEFLILETGEQRGSRSFVQFFLGCPIKLSEVDVLSI